MNLISLSSFELCCIQIYNTHTHTHTRTHTQTHTHKHTHTQTHTHTHTHLHRHTHTHTYIHTYTQTFSRKCIFRLRELRNIANHRNLGVEKFHRYKAFSLRKQKCTNAPKCVLCAENNHLKDCKIININVQIVAMQTRNLVKNTVRIILPVMPKLVKY